MQLSNNNNSIRTEFSIKNEWEQGFTGKLDILNEGEAIKDWTIEFDSSFDIEPEMIWGAEIVSHEGDRYVLKSVDYNKTINPQQEISVSFNANKVNGQIISPTNIFFDDGVEDSPVVDAPQTEADTVEETPVVDAPQTEADTVEETPVVDAPQTEADTVEESPVVDAPQTEADTVEETPVVENSPGENTTNSDTLSIIEDDLSANVDFTLIDDWGSGFEGKISITNNTGSNIDTWNLEFDLSNPINNIWDAEIESNEDGSYVISHSRWNREIQAGETITFGFTGDNSVTTEPENFELDGFTFDSPSISESIYTDSNPDLEPELQLNENYQGRATFYDAANPSGGIGASGYDVPVESELHKIVAMNNVQWNGSEASGGFFEVSGPKQRDGDAPIIVQVVDYLYERADGFDMSAEAFEMVADPIDGVVNINYQLISPSDDYVTAYGYNLGQGIVVEGIAGTNPYYAAVRLNNHRHPIESVDLITDDGLVDLDRESDNRFVLNGEYPLNGAQDLLVTDIFGQQVTLDDVNITNGSEADIVTGEQFEIL